MHTKSRMVLVAGGAGYIGSHMVLALQRAGFIPVILDNLSKGRRNIIPGVDLIIGDIEDKALLHQLFTAYSFSAVMHFAALIEVAESVRNPSKYYHNNVVGSFQLLESMHQHNVRHLIFSSSAAVYGEPDIMPISEDYPVRPINPYGRSKYMIEEMIKDFAQSYDISYTILRYFNAAGADPESKLCEHHEPESHLIPLALQVLAGEREQIVVYGEDYPTPDGTCIRDYIHVNDLCEAHLRAFERLQASRANAIYNLGQGIGYSVNEVLTTAEQVTQKKLKRVSGKRRAGDPAALVADPALAMRELRWAPENSHLEQLIRDAWRAMRLK